MGMRSTRSIGKAQSCRFAKFTPSDGGEETRGCKDKDGDRMGCTECKGRGVACPAVGSAVVEVHHEGN